jgi:hypothetical protein
MDVHARRGSILVVTAFLVALLGGCSQNGPATTINGRPPHGVSRRCVESPPRDACASEVAHELGFRLAWFPVPHGWTAGDVVDPPLPGFVGRFGVSNPVATERFHRGGLVVVIESGGDFDRHTLSAHRRFRVDRAVVREASGALESRASGIAWEVFDAWSLHGHPYRLYLLAYPGHGPVRTLAEGRSIARRMLSSVVYTRSA